MYNIWELNAPFIFPVRVYSRRRGEFPAEVGVKKLRRRAIELLLVRDENATQNNDKFTAQGSLP